MPLVPTQLAPSNVPAYPHIMPAVPDTMALGTHSLIFYNGLILNDRQRPDLYKIDDIDGLGGADIRDIREPKQADHGENPHDAYWGGQTITLTGKMEAGSMQQLTRMERDLRAAFGSLVESPMKFNWWDVNEQFYEPLQSNAWWKVLSGSGYSVAEGRLVAASAGSSLIYYGKREYYDLRLLAEFRELTAAPTNGAGIAACVTAENSYIKATVSNSGGVQQIKLILVSPTESRTIQTVALSANYTTVWLELRTVGDEIELFIYSQNPDEVAGVAPAAEIKTVVMGTDAERFGYGVSGYAGLILESNEYSCGGFKAEGIYPGDLYLNVRPIADPIIKGTLQSSVHKFKKEFQLAVRASDPHIRGCVPVFVSIETGKVPGAGVFIEYAEQGLVVINRGTWTAQTICIFQVLEREKLNEAIHASIEVRNLTTGEFFSMRGVPLPESTNGAYVIVDSTKFTIVDQAGNNYFKYFDPTSSMITLAPGPNQLEFLVRGMKVGMRIYWNHTYK